MHHQRLIQGLGGLANHLHHRPDRPVEVSQCVTTAMGGTAATILLALPTAMSDGEMVTSATAPTATTTFGRNMLTAAVANLDHTTRSLDQR
jgi:hypothetical protein